MAAWAASVVWVAQPPQVAVEVAGVAAEPVAAALAAARAFAGQRKPDWAQVARWARKRNCRLGSARNAPKAFAVHSR